MPAYRVRRNLHVVASGMLRWNYKRSALSLVDGTLRLSNGRGHDSLLLKWLWSLLQTVVIRWTGDQYEAIATYQVNGPQQENPASPTVEERREQKVAGIDLGEVHIAVSINTSHLLCFDNKDVFGPSSKQYTRVI